jgi:hypothetical protein
LGLFGFLFNVTFVCLFADAVYSIFSEGEYLKIIQLLFSGAVLIWMFSVMFSSCADTKVVHYDTSDYCPITDVVEGYDYNKLPLVSVSKNVSWSEESSSRNKITSDGSKSTITRRAYGCYKYLYLTSSSEYFKVIVDNNEVSGEIVKGTGLNAHTYMYRYDIENGDYIQIKNKKKKNLKLNDIKLYNQKVSDTSKRSDSNLNSENKEQVSEKITENVDKKALLFDGKDLPIYPDNNKYWVIFKEGTRGGRIEMTTVDIDERESAGAQIEWNRSLKLINTMSVGKYNQYYYSAERNKWIEYGTYNKFTDYAIEVLGSNMDIVDTSGNLKVERLASYEDLH